MKLYWIHCIGGIHRGIPPPWPLPHPLPLQTICIQDYYLCWDSINICSDYTDHKWWALTFCSLIRYHYLNMSLVLLYHLIPLLETVNYLMCETKINLHLPSNPDKDDIQCPDWVYSTVCDIKSAGREIKTFSSCTLYQCSMSFSFQVPILYMLLFLHLQFLFLFQKNFLSIVHLFLLHLFNLHSQLLFLISCLLLLLHI